MYREDRREFNNRENLYLITLLRPVISTIQTEVEDNKNNRKKLPKFFFTIEHVPFGVRPLTVKSEYPSLNKEQNLGKTRTASDLNKCYNT